MPSKAGSGAGPPSRSRTTDKLTIAPRCDPGLSSLFASVAAAAQSTSSASPQRQQYSSPVPQQLRQLNLRPDRLRSHSSIIHDDSEVPYGEAGTPGDDNTSMYVEDTPVPPDTRSPSHAPTEDSEEKDKHAREFNRLTRVMNAAALWIRVHAYNTADAVDA
ncbi:hypothetical protein BDZ97DRAFT_1925893 [Flammula alnicola]|nr:hypothetical protein BDZ97DRAFT_1925893 [Flammula alnicola]